MATVSAYRVVVGMNSSLLASTTYLYISTATLSIVYLNTSNRVLRHNRKVPSNRYKEP
jgi:hypothetical protein